MEKISITSLAGGRRFWNLIKEKTGIDDKANQAQVTAIAAQVAGKAERVQPAWTNLTLLNTCTSGADGDDYGPSFMKDTLGFIHLRGWLLDSVQGTTIAANLPAGYRPGKDLNFSIPIAGGIVASVSIQQNGDIHVGWSGLTNDGSYGYRLENCTPFFAEA